MCLMHYCISADTIFFLSFVATNCGPTSFHIANHHHCSWLVVGREKSGLGSCSAASSGAGTVECHGGTSWQRSLQAAGYQSQCTVGGEKLCPVFTEALLSWVAIDVPACHQNARCTLLCGCGWNTCYSSHSVALLTPWHENMFLHHRCKALLMCQCSKCTWASVVTGVYCTCCQCCLKVQAQSG